MRLQLRPKSTLQMALQQGWPFRVVLSEAKGPALYSCISQSSGRLPPEGAVTLDEAVPCCKEQIRARDATLSHLQPFPVARDGHMGPVKGISVECHNILG